MSRDDSSNGSAGGRPRSGMPRGEFTNTASNTSTTSSGDRTTIVNLGAGSSTKLTKRILPLVQVTAGPEHGRIVSLNEKLRIVMGRSKDTDLPLLDPSCSRLHAEIFVGPDESIHIRDNGSTNGTKINGKRISDTVELHDGDRIQLGDNTMLKFSLVPEDEAKAQMDVYYRATRDALTNAFNRRQFEESLNREIALQNRGGPGLGLIIFDVDHFKKINDSFGHLVGDEVLREIGKRVPTCIRKEDIFARIGGEEFAVVTRNETLDGLAILCERIRVAMESTAAVFEGRSVIFTISSGYTLLADKKSCTLESFIQLADEALYEAKNAGRNRSVSKLPA